MESTFPSEQKTPKRPHRLVIQKQLARPDRSFSPTLFPVKSLTKLPPLNSSKKYHSSTPEPRLENPEKQCLSTSIIKPLIFPEIPSKKLVRAPSVNDLPPVLSKIPISKEITCGSCKQKALITDEVQLNEFKIWATCPRCQDSIFHTRIVNEIFEVITFRSTGEYSEFSLEAKISFWMEGRLWESVEQYISTCGKHGAGKANLQKIKQHPRLEQLLRMTDEKELIYFLPGNRYWGVGFNGIGGNRLGKVLMKIRSELV